MTTPPQINPNQPTDPNLQTDKATAPYGLTGTFTPTSVEIQAQAEPWGVVGTALGQGGTVALLRDTMAFSSITSSHPAAVMWRRPRSPCPVSDSPLFFHHTAEDEGFPGT